jgi:hypothetical protein
MSNGEGGKLARLIQPTTFDGACLLAERLCTSDLIPKGFKPKLKPNMSPEERTLAMQTASANIVIAWEMGAEVGLSPMTALQSIAVIGGRPMLYGEAPLGVVLASGHLEWIKEDLDEATKTATCEMKRVKMDQTVSRSFSMAEADAAKVYEYDAAGSGRWIKLSERQTYQSWWRDMIRYRARGRVVKALFADVMKGLDIREAAIETDGPTSGTVIDVVAEPENPFLPQRKPITSEPSVAAVIGVEWAVVDEGPAAATGKRGRPKQSAAVGETPAEHRLPDAPAAESSAVVDGQCDMAVDTLGRCTGPAGHEGAHLFAGDLDCSVIENGKACWAGKDHTGPHVYEPEEEALKALPVPADPKAKGLREQPPGGGQVAGQPGQGATAPPVPPAQGRDANPPAQTRPTSGTDEDDDTPQQFVLFGKPIVTKGITEAQILKSIDLSDKADARMGQGWTRQKLGQLLKVDAKQASRKDLTRKQGARFLEILEAALQNQPGTAP